MDKRLTVFLLLIDHRGLYHANYVIGTLLPTENAYAVLRPNSEFITLIFLTRRMVAFCLEVNVNVREYRMFF